VGLMPTTPGHDKALPNKSDVTCIPFMITIQRVKVKSICSIMQILPDQLPDYTYRHWRLVRRA
jgi:hypothetical protein